MTGAASITNGGSHFTMGESDKMTKRGEYSFLRWQRKRERARSGRILDVRLACWWNGSHPLNKLTAIKFSIKKRFSPLNHSEKGERKTMMKKMRNETNKKGANAAERYMLCCAMLLT